MQLTVTTMQQGDRYGAVAQVHNTKLATVGNPQGQLITDFITTAPSQAEATERVMQLVKRTLRHRITSIVWRDYPNT